MTNLTSTVENIQALTALEGMVSQYLDSLKSSIQVDVNNGEVNGEGCAITPGVLSITTCTNLIKISPHDQWVTDTPKGSPPVAMHPPSDTEVVGEGQGFVASLASSATARGSFLVLPIQLGRLWLPCTMRELANVKDAFAPYPFDAAPAKVLAKCPEGAALAYWPILYIAGYNGWKGAPGMALPSLTVLSVPYQAMPTPSIQNPQLHALENAPYIYAQDLFTVVSSVGDTGSFGDIYEFTIDPMSQNVIENGKVTGHSIVTGIAQFMDDNGEPCAPHVQCRASQPDNDNTVITLTVTVTNSLSSS